LRLDNLLRYGHCRYNESPLLVLPALLYSNAENGKKRRNEGNERRSLFQSESRSVHSVRRRIQHGSSNDQLKISHLNDGSRSADRTKFCLCLGLSVRRRLAHVLESNFLRYNLTAFNRFPSGIYLDSAKPALKMRGVGFAVALRLVMGRSVARSVIAMKPTPSVEWRLLDK